MSETTRSFVAIVVPEENRKRLGRLQQELALDASGVRWVKSEHMHMTVAFLGDVPNPDLYVVCRAVEESVRDAEPFELHLESLGAFPNPSRPRSLWVGLTGPGIPVLEGLQTAMARALRSAGYGTREEKFTPHVTIGRIKSDRRSVPDLRPVIERKRGWSGGSFIVREIVTFASELSPDGPCYTPLSKAALGGGKTQPTP